MKNVQNLAGIGIKDFKSKNRKKLFKKISQYKLIYLALIPVVALYIIFSYFPMYGIVIALKDFRPSKGILGSEWADPLFSNFTQVFDTPYFMRSIKNTLVISLLKIVFCFPAPIILALLMHELRLKKVSKVVQTIIYLPNFISWVVFGSIVYDIFGYEGVVNNVMVLLNLDRVAFMSDKNMYYPILIIFTILKDAGWGSIIYMAAISSVSPDLYEAAQIDGCGRIRMMWNITLPCIAPIITIQFLLAMGGIMNAGFDAIFNTYNKQIYEVADILDTYIYRTGISDGNFEMATAIGLFKSLINFMLLLGANFVVKKINGIGLYDVSD